jgi:pimeloyl-ACP methyl ester carboxylesterase
LVDFIDSMRIRQFDVLALGQGATAAALLVAERSKSVRRFVALDPPAGVQPAPALVLSGAQAAAATRSAALHKFLSP